MDQLTINVRGAAQALGVSPSTVKTLIRKGQISSVRVGGRRLIHTASLRAVASSGTAPPADADA